MAHHTGAILQRDGKTFALVTRIPAGIVTPGTLEKIAAVARKYQIPILKLTSGQRFMLIGMSENDLVPIYRDLGPDRKSTRLNSSHVVLSRMPSSA